MKGVDAGNAEQLVVGHHGRGQEAEHPMFRRLDGGDVARQANKCRSKKSVVATEKPPIEASIGLIVLVALRFNVQGNVLIDLREFLAYLSLCQPIKVDHQHAATALG